VSIKIFRPRGASGVLPVVLFTHGAGWVFGDAHTHGRLVAELATRAGAAAVFTNYNLSPEARYPTAIEEIYATLEWIAAHGAEQGLDPARIAVAGDSVGGNMTAAITIMAKQRSGPAIAAQLLYYPVTNASFDTGSYEQFATQYWLTRQGMQWYWDQYAPSADDRAQITASPLRASLEDLAGLPPALVIVGEADVLRDEGEAYAAKLRQAGVPVTAVRCQGIIHDFVMVNSLRDTHAALAATAQGGEFLRAAHLRKETWLSPLSTTTASSPGLIVCTVMPMGGELVAQGRGDAFQRVLGGAVRAQAAHGAGDEEAAACPRVDPLADDVLDDTEVGEDVGLEGAPHQFDGDLGHRAAVADGGVAEECVEVPRHRGRELLLPDSQLDATDLAGDGLGQVGEPDAAHPLVRVQLLPCVPEDRQGRFLGRLQGNRPIGSTAAVIARIRAASDRWSSGSSLLVRRNGAR
jgi:acetyl esterase